MCGQGRVRGSFKQTPLWPAMMAAVTDTGMTVGVGRFSRWAVRLREAVQGCASRSSVVVLAAWCLVEAIVSGSRCF